MTFGAQTSRVPRWVHFVLGAVALGIGLYVLVRPFSSLRLLVILIGAGLIVTGISRLVGVDGEETGLGRVVGLLWIGGGIAVLAWPDLTVRALVWVVGIWLVVDGVVDVVSGFRGGADQRLASFLKGVASIVFGVLALAWPDITILVIALVFAVKLIVFGIVQIFAGFRGGRRGATSEAPGRLRPWVNVGGAVLALLVALGLAALGSQLRKGEPVVDAFYVTPAEIPADPGVLIAAESFERNMPDGARAWRILYSTTRDEGVPAVASAVVVVPEGVEGPLPVIAWAHGTTGIDETCAPSVLASGFESGAFFSLDRVLDEGWALVATDYIGLGTEGPHPYLIGQGEGRSVLDSVRAAHQLDEVSLEDQTVVWGHSQGGNAALWTGVLAPTYASDANVIGVAALAPASDLVGLMESLPGVTGGNIFAAYIMAAYSESYTDVRLDDYVVPGGQVTIGEVAERCLGEPAVFASLLSSLAVDWSMFTADLDSGPAAARLAENVPPYTIEAPLLLGQGAADSLVRPDVQDRYVNGMCAVGRQVDYRKYEGRDHVPLVEPDSPLIPELIEWTHARLAGEDPISTCS